MTLEISPRHSTTAPASPWSSRIKVAPPILLPSAGLLWTVCHIRVNYQRKLVPRWPPNCCWQEIAILFSIHCGNPACGSEWMMGDIKQHVACCCTALGVNVANFMLSSFYNCNVANMFERAGVRSCVGTFSSSIHVLSMAQSAKYTLHLLLLQCSVIFCTVEHLHGVRNTKPEWLHVAK